MMKHASDRRGFSLMEILIAMMIMAIGVTAVIALFPIGVHRVRQAVIDTRSTLLARNALEFVWLRQIPNDPNLIAYDQYVGATTPAALDHAPPATINRYAFHSTAGMLSGDWNDPSDTTVPLLATEPVWSYPILIDPWLHESLEDQAVAAGTPTNADRFIDIETYYGGAGSSPYFNIPVYSLREITGNPYSAGLGEIGPVTPAAGTTDLRQAFLSRWFSATSDLEYDPLNRVLPFNANAQDTASLPSVLTYVDPNLLTAPDNVPSITRTYPYTFAVMLQRVLVEDPDPMAVPVTPRPSERNFGSLTTRIHILCFHKRNLLTQPYTVVEACFFNNSSKATLSWPVATAPPELRRGMWLMEGSIAKDGASSVGNRISGMYDENSDGVANDDIDEYRRTCAFHRIVDYSDPIPDPATPTRYLQEVQLAGPAGAESDYLRNHTGADLRPPDPYAAATWPYEHAVGATVLDGTVIYMPVVLFDGLVEVFQEIR